jgi:hypothetical protein
MVAHLSRIDQGLADDNCDARQVNRELAPLVRAIGRPATSTSQLSRPPAVIDDAYEGHPAAIT